MSADSSRLDTLDAMRGIAAILVMLGHIGGFYYHPFELGEYLAVDFFFVLSGFVVAKAYDSRLASPDYFWSFVKIRIIRLYPLILLSIVIATVAAGGMILAGAPAAPSARTLLVESGLEAFVLPARTVPPYELFPLNPPMWSLFFEIAINIAYGLFARRIGNRILSLVVLVCLVGVVAAAFLEKSVNVGWSWHTAWGGAVRVGFSFPLGVLFYRLGLGKSRVVSWNFVFPPIVLAAILLLPVPGPLRFIVEPIFVAVVSPILLLAGARFEPPASLRDLCSKLGEISYPLYAIHYPLIFAISGLAVGLPFGRWGLVAGLAVGLPLLALAVSRVYDIPVRRFLTKLFGTKRSASYAQ